MTTQAAPTRPWRAAATAQPLVAWRDAEVAALGALLRETVASWSAAWGLAEQGLEVRCVSGAGEAAASWELLAARGRAAAWIALPDTFQAALTRALWGERASAGPLAQEVCAACARDLRSTLAGALRLDAPSASLSPPSGYWSGALEVSVCVGARVLLNADAARALLEPRSKVAETKHRFALTPIRDAIATTPMRLRVHLGECEMEVCRLADLQQGDVVRLPHTLDAPLQVRDVSGRALFGAFLARSGGFKAVELVPHLSAGMPASQGTLP